jgi:hypothetical protein
MNADQYFNEDVFAACLDLVGRAGASESKIGYMNQDAETVEEAEWYAEARYKGVRISVSKCRTPTDAALGLAQRLLTGATCKCGEKVSLSDKQAGCRWRLVGKRWEPGCTAPAIKVQGDRGDPAAIKAAMMQSMNRRDRRRAKKK